MISRKSGKMLETPEFGHSIIEYYEPDREAMLEKLQEVHEYLVKSDRLLGEAASGGKHNTGCHVDFINERISKEFDRATASVMDAKAKVKTAIYFLEKDNWREHSRVFHFAKDIDIGCVEVYKNNEASITDVKTRVTCSDCLKIIEERGY